MGILIEKIYEHWDEDRAKIVEKLYTKGLRLSGHDSTYIKSILPSLANTARWRYKDRIVFELLQPDLFPETLKSDFDPDVPKVVKIQKIALKRARGMCCVDEWVEPVYDI